MVESAILHVDREPVGGRGRGAGHRLEVDELAARIGCAIGRTRVLERRVERLLRARVHGRRVAPDARVAVGGGGALRGGPAGRERCEREQHRGASDELDAHVESIARSVAGELLTSDSRVSLERLGPSENVSRVLGPLARG